MKTTLSSNVTNSNKIRWLSFPTKYQYFTAYFKKSCYIDPKFQHDTNLKTIEITISFV